MLLKNVSTFIRIYFHICLEREGREEGREQTYGYQKLWGKEGTESEQ